MKKSFGNRRILQTDASAAQRKRSFGGSWWRSSNSPRLIGVIDCESEIRACEVVIQGWVFSEDDPIVAVLVFIDGQVSLARCGIDRPDVARVHGETLNIRHSGFQFESDLRGMEGREVTFRAAAVTSDGRTEVFAERQVTCRSQPQIYFHPIAGEITTNDYFLAVSGVVLMDQFVSSIQIFLNGTLVGNARFNAFSTPEFGWSKMPMSAISGFTSMIDIRACEPRMSHLLTAIATDIDGNFSQIAELGFQIRKPFSLEDITGLLRRESSVRSTKSFEDSAPLRLLVVTHHLGIGGGQFYLQELLRQLVGLIDVELLVVAEVDGALRDELETLGATVVVTGACPLGDAFAYESFVQRIVQIGEKFQPEFILANTAATIFGLDVASILEIPSVIAIHESFIFDEWFIAARGNFATHPYVRQRFREALSSCSAVIFESEATQEIWSDVVDGERSVLIRYGIETKELISYCQEADRDEIRDSLGIDADAVVFLCIGVFEARKSQAMLASAFALATREHPEAHLILVGASDDPYSVAVKQHIDGLEVDGKIRVISIVRDLRPWYAISDFLISASDIESMPRTMMEGMAFGLPVVAADAPGVSELVVDGSTGWLCSTRDLLQLSGTITKAINESEIRRREMAEAAVEKVLKDHTSSGYGLEFARLIGSLLPGRVQVDKR